MGNNFYRWGAIGTFCDMKLCLNSACSRPTGKCMLEQIVQVCVVRGVQMSAAMWICDDENQVWSSVAESGTDIKNSQDGTLK